MCTSHTGRRRAGGRATEPSLRACRADARERILGWSLVAEEPLDPEWDVEEQSRDRPGSRPSAHRRGRLRGRPAGRRGRAVRQVQGQDRPERARSPGRSSRRQDHLRHRGHAHERRRGQDHDLGLADAGLRQDRRVGRALPAPGLARPGLRRQGRRCRRRPRAGRADGGSEPPLHRRPARDHRREQPARRVHRRARDARQRARHRRAHDRLAPRRRHERPRPAQHRDGPRRRDERLPARDRLRHHGGLRGDGDPRARVRPPRPAQAARRDHGGVRQGPAIPSPPSRSGARARWPCC